MNDIEVRLTQGLLHPYWDTDLGTEHVLGEVLLRRARARSGPGRTWIGISGGVMAAACGAVLAVVLQHPAQQSHHLPVGRPSTSTPGTAPAPVSSSFSGGGSVSPSPRCRPPKTVGLTGGSTDPSLPTCPTTGGLTDPSAFSSPSR